MPNLYNPETGERIQAEGEELKAAKANGFQLVDDSGYAVVDPANEEPAGLTEAEAQKHAADEAAKAETKAETKTAKAEVK